MARVESLGAPASGERSRFNGRAGIDFRALHDCSRCPQTCDIRSDQASRASVPPRSRMIHTTPADCDRLPTSGARRYPTTSRTADPCVNKAQRPRGPDRSLRGVRGGVGDSVRSVRRGRGRGASAKSVGRLRRRCCLFFLGQGWPSRRIWNGGRRSFGELIRVGLGTWVVGPYRAGANRLIKSAAARETPRTPCMIVRSGGSRRRRRLDERHV